MASEDASCRFPDYMYGQSLYIDSLAKSQGDRIKFNATDKVAGSVAEGMEGKVTISTCLEFYKSKGLDALAKARYAADRKERVYPKEP